MNCFRSAWLRAGAALLLAAAVSGCTGNSLVDTSTTAAPVLSSVVLSSSTVAGGGSVTGSVNLTAVAPTGGAAVTLSSSSPAVTVPATITVAAGNSAQSFAVTTTATPVVATITATYAAVSQGATLTVTVFTISTLQSFVLATNVSAGGAVQGTVTLTAPAPSGGITVALASNTPLATVPPTVVVPFGNVSQTFQIATSGSAIPTTAVLTASYAGVSQTARLTLGQLALSFALNSVPGGLADTGIITLPGPAPDAGAFVALASNSPNAAVPASVVVPGGATTQTFNIATINAPPTTTATITATYAGVTQAAPLVVLAYPNVVNVTCTPTTVKGGTSVPCTGTLSGPAPAGGWRIVCTTSDPSVTSPGTFTVPASSTTFQFTLGTTAVTTATLVNVQLTDVQSGISLWGQLISVTP